MSFISLRVPGVASTFGGCGRVAPQVFTLFTFTHFVGGGVVTGLGVFTVRCGGVLYGTVIICVGV